MKWPAAVLFPLIAAAQPVRDKNFYLFAILEQNPPSDLRLERIANAKRAALAGSGSFIESMRWTPEEIATVSEVLATFTAASEPLRQSRLYGPKPDLVKAWQQAAAAMNRIFDVYGLGKPPRYPDIDSISFDPQSPSFQRMLSVIQGVMADEPDGHPLFFHAPLRFAIELLRANWRDEAGRFEPMEKGENKLAFDRIPDIHWAQYKYAAIVVPGSGTDRPNQAMSPWGRARMILAARRYKAGLAPFIIVSGGYVHPKQTPFCEALEMKRALMAEFSIPADAILIEPHARHTTTNLRNAARLLYRYNFPEAKPALITTDQGQSAYIEAPAFSQRCQNELGYLPFQRLKRISQFDLEFLPSLDSLLVDPLDPLDP
jgi:hypothetical protein